MNDGQYGSNVNLFLLFDLGTSPSFKAGTTNTTLLSTITSRESRIWFLGYLWEFVPRKPIHPSGLTKKFNYTFLEIFVIPSDKATIPAPSVPLHNAMTPTMPPFGTKCQVFGFLQGPDFDLHRIGATVLKESRCQDIFQRIETKLKTPCFYTELEVLDPMGGGEVGINQPHFDARVRERKIWDNRRGNLVKVDQRYPIFCENWVNSTSEETYVFAGFSIHHIVQGSVRFFMFENNYALK
ncbi:hypothetical protein Fcan01_25960 [Folsomia candida]|uniref:Uncharacterized protein n=1 Tax=Folsomia candida TaxID=158441 RepID=A0A226D3A3_FOLCA|nr:hypothetical protein Fcan01_25960 [Folsomia candida]